MRKIAVVFPGVGYTKDRPLLYYSGKIAKSYGYELVYPDFTGLQWSKEELKDHSRLVELLKEGLTRTEAALSDYDITSEDNILFLSKSIGTVVATAYARKKGIVVKQILFTPLEYISNFIEKGNGLVFYGDHDPYAKPDDIIRIGRTYQLEMHCIKGANHSLEAGDVLYNIDELKKVMQRVDEEIKAVSDKNSENQSERKLPNLSISDNSETKHCVDNMACDMHGYKI